MAGRMFFAAILAGLCYVTICKRLFTVIPNTERCKVLDYTIVKSYTCRSKNVNRTLNLGSKEIVFQPGVSLSNYYGKRCEYNVPFDAVNNTLEIIPSGEYRVDTTSFTMIKGERKNTTLTQDYGEVKYTTAEQWKKK